MGVEPLEEQLVGAHDDARMPGAINPGDREQLFAYF